MVQKIFQYVEQNIENIVRYWVSTYYTETDEYAQRKEYDGFLVSQTQEITQLFQMVSKQIQQNYVSTSIFQNVGEDRKDIGTPLLETVQYFHLVFTATLEYLFQQLQQNKFSCSNTALYQYMLIIRKLEIQAEQDLILGYMK
ncbi:hypothetical protein BMT55_02605 [Listeria newyorkensis]|uniref:RsbT co-antagonist protein rsbRD N-terminal domain-containing protein n=1 Tax=Listeria newyorkensis TaxID=1497681 RepID=A0ABX4XQ94_9LIST|nr:MULTISPECIES: hypothetical protein [Listeria]KGL42122.1 hypothetical protein EP56_10320 [Listeriaceae bacterium FSL A5-0209]KGL38284.1 hypothetical protein EP58_16125 [Listeria newyorkensis]KMT62862.1 hypothetical protein X559_0699 [Listeria newyorkensis]PNP94396.1 hypothetical protein BMT55_02605 [Listeria newyorkensis]RQW67643.1 hypothetical protein DUK53_04815 [Listeria sp. SHR_NRA_18]